MVPGLPLLLKISICSQTAPQLEVVVRVHVVFTMSYVIYLFCFYSALYFFSIFVLVHENYTGFLLRQ